MKTKLSNLGLASLAVASLGLAMKLFHLPASNIILLIGAVGVLFVLLPDMVSIFTKHADNENKSFSSHTYISAGLVFLGLTAKLFHLPAANIIIVIGLVVFNLLIAKIVKLYIA